MTLPPHFDVGLSTYYNLTQSTLRNRNRISGSWHFLVCHSSSGVTNWGVWTKYGSCRYTWRYSTQERTVSRARTSHRDDESPGPDSCVRDLSTPTFGRKMMDLLDLSTHTFRKILDLPEPGQRLREDWNQGNKLPPTPKPLLLLSLVKYSNLLNLLLIYFRVFQNRSCILCHSRVIHEE